MLFSYILYNLTLAGSCLFIYLNEKIKAKNYKILFLILSFSFIFIPAALRYNIGVDYRAYVDIFEALKTSDLNYIEHGYKLINNLFIFLSLPVEALFAFISFITYFFIFLSLPDKNKISYLFIFITSTYFVSFFLLRSSLALSICIYAIMNYRRNNNIYYYMSLIVIASTIHISSLLYLALPFLSFRFIKSAYSNHRILIFSLLFLILYFKKEILSLIMNFVIPALGYEQYLKLDLFISAPEINTGLGIILRSLPLLAILFFAKEILLKNERDIIFINIAFISLVCIFFSSTIEIFSRLEKVFLCVYMFSIYTISINSKIRLYKLLTLFFIISQLLIFERTIISSPSDQCDGPRISPYVSIINKEDDNSLKITRLECQATQK